MSTEPSKRDRNSNFSNDEILSLSDIIKDNPEAENTKFDNESLKQKKQAWISITSIFNSSVKNGPKRTTEELRGLLEES